MKKLVVVALGGNAFLKDKEKGTIHEYETNTAETFGYFLPLLKDDYQIVITHGNGPQVCNILIQNETAKDLVPQMPLDVCVADSEGSIGYIIQQALLNQLRKHDIKRYVVTMITQVVVDSKDPAFSNPTKPIGPFYKKEEAELLKTEKKWVMSEDSGRGWRRIVPSPQPTRIIQQQMIKELVKEGHIVVAVGGGGIPIWKNKDNDYEGIEAVIDKDLASALLASEIKAPLFIILTTVPKVYINYGKPDQKALDKVSLTQLRGYLKDGHFGVGSMKPKIEAAIKYLSAVDGAVIITSAERLAAALNKEDGTHIYSDLKRKQDQNNLLLDI
ncbi:MAG: carbamate kinase [Planctomycetota bacterium]